MTVNQHIQWERLLSRFASRYSVFGADYDDLVQEGHMAILQCQQTFDPLKGVQFITYAYPRIKNAMLQYALQQGNGAVTIPMRIAGEKKQPVSANAVTAELSETFVDQAASAEEQLQAKEMDIVLLEAMDTLEHMEVLILSNRLGMNPDLCPMTHQVLSEILCMSRTNVLRIEQQAIAKVRQFIRVRTNNSAGTL